MWLPQENPAEATESQNRGEAQEFCFIYTICTFLLLLLNNYEFPDSCRSPIPAAPT